MKSRLLGGVNDDPLQREGRAQHVPDALGLSRVGTRQRHGNHLPFGRQHLAFRRRPEDAAHLEQAHVRVLVPGVGRRCAQQAWEQRGAQKGLGLVERVRHVHDVEWQARLLQIG